MVPQREPNELRAINGFVDIQANLGDVLEGFGVYLDDDPLGFWNQVLNLPPAQIAFHLNDASIDTRKLELTGVTVAVVTTLSYTFGDFSLKQLTFNFSWARNPTVMNAPTSSTVKFFMYGRLEIFGFDLEAYIMAQTKPFFQVTVGAKLNETIAVDALIKKVIPDMGPLTAIINGIVDEFLSFDLIDSSVLFLSSLPTPIIFC
jgi:hypothetical protein